MSRHYIDCRDVPSDAKCTVALSADTTEELLEAAIQHAVKVHGHEDTASFRQQLLEAMKEGSPPA